MPFPRCPDRNPYNWQPGDPWLNLINKPQKMFFILIVKSPPINVIAKEKKKKRTYQNNYFDLASSNTTFQCEWRSHFKIITRRGLEQKKKKKPIKKVTEYHFNG